MFVDIIKVFSSHGPSDAGMVEDELHRLHRKGPVATKLTRPLPLNYHVCGAILQTFHKLQSKPKTIPELKSILHQIGDDLPVARQCYERFSQTCKGVRFGR